MFRRRLQRHQPCIQISLLELGRNRLSKCDGLRIRLHGLSFLYTLAKITLFIVLGHLWGCFLHSHDLFMSFQSMALLDSLREVFRWLRSCQACFLRFIWSYYALFVPRRSGESWRSVFLTLSFIEPRIDLLSWGDKRRHHLFTSHKWACKRSSLRPVFTFKTLLFQILLDLLLLNNLV